MAKHAEEKKYNFPFLLLIICVLIIIGIITYIYIIPYFNTRFNTKDVSNSNNDTNTIIEHTSTTYKIFEDAPHLHSDEFELTVENGIATINGKIFNTSNEVVTDLNCLYTLKDADNTIYEFTIYANQIEPQSFFGFTSIVILDLSNVEDYSVKLFK